MLLSIEGRISKEPKILEASPIIWLLETTLGGWGYPYEKEKGEKEKEEKENKEEERDPNHESLVYVSKFKEKKKKKETCVVTLAHVSSCF